MTQPSNTDNVEAFLFELNELLERHNAFIKAQGYDELQVVVNYQEGWVDTKRDPVTKRWFLQQTSR